MKTSLENLFGLFDGRERESEIEEELRFHIDLLTHDLIRQNFSSAEASRAALERFGSVDQIKRQCVEIRKRNSPLVRVMKSFLVMVFLMGVLLRVFSPEYRVTRVGAILMVIGILGRLFLYVRFLGRSLSRPDSRSLLILSKGTKLSATSDNQRKLTPVERVIFDK